jgi:hypothetical protein
MRLKPRPLRPGIITGSYHPLAPASSIQHPASSIQHPASSIQHPASSNEHYMPDDQSLQVSIGDQLIQCDNVDDKMRLEPVGGILADGSAEGYRPEELQAMVDTLAHYDQHEAAARLKQLMG